MIGHSSEFFRLVRLVSTEIDEVPTHDRQKTEIVA